MNKTTLQDLKISGKSLQVSVARAGGQLTLQQAYNVMGELAGLSNWSATVAAARRRPKAPQGEGVALSLGVFKADGTPLDIRQTVQLTQEALQDILDHAVQAVLISNAAMRSRTADDSGPLSGVLSELTEAMDAVDLLSKIQVANNALDDRPSDEARRDPLAFVDEDEVAEWVGLHYRVNFDACTEAEQRQWARRYLKSQFPFDADLSTSHGKLAVLKAFGYSVEADCDQPGLWTWSSDTEGCEISEESEDDAIYAAWTNLIHHAPQCLQGNPESQLEVIFSAFFPD